MIPEGGDPSRLPDLFDQVFDLPLDWEFDRDDHQVSLDVLKEFSRLANEIAVSAMDSSYVGAICFMWSARKYVGIEQYNSHDFTGTEISAERSQRIRDELGLGRDAQPSSLAPVASSGPTLSALMLQKDAELIFEIFLQKERVILRNWGLNQHSVELIIERTHKYRRRVLMNMLQGGSVNKEAVFQALHRLMRMSEVPITATGGGRRGRWTRSSKRKSLLGAKDKMIGIATIFGNAAPLMLGQSLSVANFISTASGATVAAILPRGEARDD